MIPANVLPKQYEAQSFIAGGWAACPAQATDLDLWVSVDGDAETLNIVRERLLDHFAHQVNYRVSVEQSDELARGYIPDTTFITRKVARLTNRVTGGLIHVLVTTGDVIDVLSAFDISTHQVAILPSGQVVKGPHFTTVSQPPIVLREGGPTTAERLRKITNRYRVVSNPTRFGWRDGDGV